MIRFMSKKKPALDFECDCDTPQETMVDVRPMFCELRVKKKRR